MAEIQSVNEISTLALAYMGDAVLEVPVRQHLITKGLLRPNMLHKEAVKYVSAKAQSAFVQYLQTEGLLTEEESDVFKRGRNAKSGSVPKNTDIATYNNSTGFEAVLGYLYFTGRESRFDILVKALIDFIETERESHGR